MDLFSKKKTQNSTEQPAAPLAERMRPHSLDGFIGQEHLVGHDGVLRKQMENGTLGSMVFWGPPG